MTVTHEPDTRNGHAGPPAPDRRATGTKKARSEAAAPADTVRIEVPRDDHATLTACAERAGLTMTQAFKLAMQCLDRATANERQETAEERRERILAQFRGQS
jgi:hypothetical protein